MNRIDFCVSLCLVPDCTAISTNQIAEGPSLLLFVVFSGLEEGLVLSVSIFRVVRLCWRIRFFALPPKTALRLMQMLV